LLKPGDYVNGNHAPLHYHASVLLDAGESIKTLSDYMGHGDVTETLKTYAT
jgi:integrase